MGCGIYLVWPAFYTDVTNSYRLGRAGRIRTDLGGVYFNGLFVIGLVLVYLRTGSPVLLVAVLATNMEIVQQLLPTLRFDGYYIVADLVGIPDLFKYIGPILKRSFLRRPADQRLDALKRWPQLVVTVWVLTVLPALAFQLGLVLSRMPELATTAWRTAVSLAGDATADDSSVLAAVTSGLQILFLLLPLVGALLALWQLSGLVVRLVRRRRSQSGEQERASGGMRPRMPVSFLLGGLAVSTVLAVGGSTGQTKAPRTAASVRGSAPRDPRDDEYELIFEGLR
jgi:putative peptide zinc metalloprotease protein